MEIELNEHERVKLLNTDKVYEIMQRILLRENIIDRNREHLWVIGLENNHRLLFIELVSFGSVNRTIVEPMEVFSFALQKRAVKIILVHNHPSGELTPSAADLDITDHMIQVGLIVNTPVLDHLIITETGYMSFKDTGLIDELSHSEKYVPPYIIKERMTQQKAEIENAEKLKIAKGLKEKGIDHQAIAEVTGLTAQQIKQL